MKKYLTIIAIIICGFANAQTGYLVQPAKWKFTRPQWLDSGAWIKNISKLEGQQRVLVYDSVKNTIGYKHISAGNTYTAGRGLTLNSNVFRLDTPTVSNLAYVSLNSTTTAKSVYQMTSTIPVHFKTAAAATLLYLDEANGRVGIGTASPIDDIHIQKTKASYASVSIKVDNLSSTGFSLFVARNNANLLAYLGTQGTGITTYGPAGESFVGTSSTGLNFVSNDVSQMRLDNTGRFTIGSTTSISRLAIPIAPTASANYGLVSLGNGAFDGSTSGFFTGSASGTTLAINNASGFAGNLIDAQVGGSSKFKVDNIGNVTAKNGKLSGVLFTQTATATVANTTTETTLTSTGSGSLTLPANFFEVGKSIVIHAEGYHSATSNPDITVKIKLGGTTYMTTGTVVSGNSTDAYCEIKGTITCRTTGASGTVQAQGFYVETGAGDFPFGMPNTTTQTIDTTSAQTVDITVQWGTASASNTISITNLIIEAKN